jgi:hypothetical protein
MTTDHQTNAAAEATFLDPDNKFIDVPTAVAILGKHPDVLPTIIGYTPNGAADYGMTPLGALTVLIELGHIQLFREHPTTKEWYLSSGRFLLWKQENSPLRGFLIESATSAALVPAGLMLAQIFSAIEIARTHARQRAAKAARRAEVQEDRRHRMAALTAARDDEARALKAMYDQMDRASQAARDRKRSIERPALAAMLRSDDAEAKQALALARQQDQQAASADSREADQLRADYKAAQERHRQAQVEALRSGLISQVQ